jgi:hypothetical protein
MVRLGFISHQKLRVLVPRVNLGRATSMTSPRALNSLGSLRVSDGVLRRTGKICSDRILFAVEKVCKVSLKPIGIFLRKNFVPLNTFKLHKKFFLLVGIWSLQRCCASRCHAVMQEFAH